MKKRTLIFTIAVFGFASAIASSPALAQQDPHNPTAVPPDNTKVNQRDASHDTLTPMDQPNNSVDVKLAAAARDALVKDNSLSTMAHNVKLVAANGVVTLRGPVLSESEKGKVAERVQTVPGVSRVDNQLEVKRN